MSTLAVPIAVSAHHPEYLDWDTPEFEQVWERTDLPVHDGHVNRTWIWGPGATSDLINETYVDADNQSRAVQYGDKSRQELPWNSDVDPDSPWFITQGLLATELMTGMLQVGDETFWAFEPANIPVAGDPDDELGPTYAVMGTLIDQPARPTGGAITQVLTSDGTISDNPELAIHGFTDAYYIPETGHNIASPFWEFMNSSSIVYQNGQLEEDVLFLNPFYAIGFPKTEAYWGWVKVGGVEQNVLIQCFERRCLTKAVDNPEGWKVESGNVGLHYHHWRYEMLGDPQHAPDDEPPAVDPPPIDDDPPPADDDPPVPGEDSVSVTPSNVPRTVGETHEIDVTVLDGENSAMSGVSVTARVIDGPNLNTDLETAQGSTTGTTGTDGSVTMSYEGHVSGIGTDTIQVSAQGVGSQNVSVHWQADEAADVLLTIEPNPTISVDDVAVLTALVTDEHGNPVPGVVVAFESAIHGDLAIELTNEDGEAIIPDHHHTVADDEEEITATEQDNDNSDSKTITWVAGEPWGLMLSLFGDNASQQNEVGTTHRVLAFVFDQHVNPVGGVSVSFAIDGDTGSPEAGHHWTWHPESSTEVDQGTVEVNTTVRETNEDGEVGFSYRAQNPGFDEITAEGTEVDVGTGFQYKTWCSVIVEDGDGIRDAVNGASAGDTICIEPGTYNEPDTIRINQQDDVSLVGAGSDEVTIVREGGAYGLQVDHSDNVELRGFTVRDADSTNHGHGLKLEFVDNIRVVDVHAIDNQRTGIDLNTIDGAELVNVVATGTNVGNGIAITNSNDVLLHFSSTAGNAWGGVALYANDPLGGPGAVSNVTITNSTFDDESAGVYLQYGDFTNIAITDNSFVNNDAGLWFDNESGDDPTVTATGNTFSDNEVAVGVQPDVDVENIVINGNNIAGNNDGVQNGGIGELDATNNWWGHSSGPGGEGDGDGDTVSENVEFDPWSTSPH